MAAIVGLIAALCTDGSVARADEEQAACDTVAPNQGALRISVSGMRSAKGNVTITIYPDDAAHFLDGNKVARQQLPTTLPATIACFVLPAPRVCLRGRPVPRRECERPSRCQRARHSEGGLRIF